MGVLDGGVQGADRPRQAHPASRIGCALHRAYHRHPGVICSSTSRRSVARGGRARAARTSGVSCGTTWSWGLPALAPEVPRHPRPAVYPGQRRARRDGQRTCSASFTATALSPSTCSSSRRGPSWWVGEVAYRANLFARASVRWEPGGPAARAGGAHRRAGRRPGRRRAARRSEPFWSQALRAEVYTLSRPLHGLDPRPGGEMRAGGGTGRLAGRASSSGLSLGNPHGDRSPAPWSGRPPVVRPRRHRLGARCRAAHALGVAIDPLSYLYLPLRQARIRRSTSWRRRRGSRHPGRSLLDGARRHVLRPECSGTRSRRSRPRSSPCSPWPGMASSASPPRGGTGAWGAVAARRTLVVALGPSWRRPPQLLRELTAPRQGHMSCRLFMVLSVWLGEGLPPCSRRGRWWAAADWPNACLPSAPTASASPPCPAA